MTMHVIGAIKGYSWDQIWAWYASLRHVGFAGEIHVICYGSDEATIGKLRDRGVQVHPARSEGQVVIDRFRDLAGILAGIPARDWVIASDVGDIVFQRDPVEYVRRVDACELVLPSEGIRFQDQPWCRANLLDSFPEHVVDLREELVLNAGLITGRAERVAQLAAEVFEMCRRRPSASSHDQAAMNILVRSPSWREITMVTTTEDAWCYCCASSICAPHREQRKLVEPMASVKDGLCYNEHGEPFHVLHHYTRIEAWKAAVESRLRSVRPGDGGRP